jgi:TonB family protein
MPITEIPPSSEQRPVEPSTNGKRSRYDSYEAHELLQVINELEDDRRWARLREGIWISIIAHMILFSLISWGPRYLLHMPKVVNPADVLRQRKDLTYLDLPPDALKQIKPKHSDAISDKDRQAQSKNPTIDKKTLQELQAMKKAGPPAPTPAPQPQQQAPQQPAPQQQQAQQQPQQHPTQPLQSNQQAQLDAPRPSPVPARPSFNAGPLSAGDAIRQAARDAARQRGGGEGGDYGANAPNAHPGLKAGAEILSDTMGVDFGPYLNQVIRETRQTWEPLIPESARPPLMKNGTVAVEFMIMPDGRVKQMKLVGPSGDPSLDRGAWGAITGSNYPPLPKEFKGPYLALRFFFLYNPRPGQDY